MIPMLMKIRIPTGDDKAFNLYIPMLIIWLILIIIFLLVLPFFVIAAIFTWYKGYGKIILLIWPMIFSILFHLKGLMIDIEDKKNQIYFSFI